VVWPVFGRSTGDWAQARAESMMTHTIAVKRKIPLFIKNLLFFI
jgi:hypothetical protein